MNWMACWLLCSAAVMITAATGCHPSRWDGRGYFPGCGRFLCPCASRWAPRVLGWWGGDVCALQWAWAVPRACLPFHLSRGTLYFRSLASKYIVWVSLREGWERCWRAWQIIDPSCVSLRLFLKRFRNELLQSVCKLKILLLISHILFSSMNTFLNPRFPERCNVQSKTIKCWTQQAAPCLTAR